ncbi:hypothetical protein GALL_425270 [mine drainage metagenome]|uniref:Uncharacterized protein n=1 Tax=mine drainage metagenome TaxID=410659 RepID=A0A1J5QIH4_9ZZZZ
MALDPDANAAGSIRIEQPGARPALVIPADEEAMMRSLCLALIQETSMP